MEPNCVAAVRSGQLYISSNSGSSWTAEGPNGHFWSSVASSADGTKLVAAANGGQIYTSTNSGTIWTQRVSGTTNWVAVASSADGSRLVATASSGQIYVSTDSGATWVAQNSPVTGQITSVASSSDGSRLAVTAGGAGRQVIFLPPPIPARPGRNWREHPQSLGRPWPPPLMAASLRQRSMAATFTFPRKAARRPARRVI